MRKYGMKTFFLLLLAVPSLVLAGEAAEKQKSIEEKAKAILARKGLEVDVAIQSQFLQADYDGVDRLEDKTSASNKLITNSEKTGYTLFDFGLRFRPWEAIGARTVLRFGSGYQNFFNDLTKTIEARWLAVEGRMPEHLSYSVGDFKQRYSPLTLWSPELDFLYEPEVFRRQRQMAQDEEFISNNERVLQGLNLNYRRPLGSIVEMRLDFMATRLRRSLYLDPSGAMGNLIPNSDEPGSRQAASSNRYALAVNNEWFFLDKALFVGGTWMNIFDRSATNDRRNLDLTSYATATSDMLVPDHPEENLTVLAGRFGVDLADMLGNKGLIVDLVVEGAQSRNAPANSGFATQLDSNGVPALDPATGALLAPVPLYGALPESEGLALRADLSLGYVLSPLFGIRVDGEYLQTERNFQNELTQSPTFVPRRIALSDKEPNNSRYGVHSVLYSTFDALYNYNPKFSPIAGELVSSTAAKSWTKFPFIKSSYSNSVYSREELDLIARLTDPAVQLIDPFGPATPNRTGFGADLTVDFLDTSIQITGTFTAQEELEAVLASSLAKFSELGGGLRVDAGKAVGWELPQVFTASWVQNAMTSGNIKIENTMLQMGAQLRFHKRFGFLGGLQQLDQISENPLPLSFDFDPLSGYAGAEVPEDVVLVGSAGDTATNVEHAREVTWKGGTQLHWVAGMEYFLKENIWVQVTYGEIVSEKDYSYTDSFYRQGDDGAGNTVYQNADGLTVGSNAEAQSELQSGGFVHKFTMPLMQASINVKF